MKNRLLIGLAALSAATPSWAADVTVTPLIDLRLRWENVDQDGSAEEADAVTFRARTGAELSAGDWRLISEAEATIGLVERYFSGLNGKTHFPLVADPDNFELNRLQLQYRGLPKTVVTAGRQRINIDDQRFIGSVGWRQNEQTFDAVRLEHGDSKGLQVDLAYAWSVRTIWGTEGADARQQAIRGDNAYASASYPTPIGKLSAFAFIVDQDEAIVSAYRQSSQSYGVRLSGSRPLTHTVKLTYAASYARQSDYGKNPNDYRANYALAELGVDIGVLKFGAGYELLGADGGAAFTSFQTPLATLHKFQGWADKFLTTPPNGVQDYYASAGYGWKNAAGFDAISASLVYHRFDSARLDFNYGNEWNALISAKKGRWSATAKLAAYDADEFATDTRKLWLQLEWAY
ncbi:MAG: alginate export family protein [Pseudomonadota bacterium]|nr:alginate export family protein [Pseudomonadota bacterium]